MSWPAVPACRPSACCPGWTGSASTARTPWRWGPTGRLPPRRLPSRRLPAPLLDVAAVRFPRISNFTDLDALAVEPAVRPRWVDSPASLGRPDLLVLPGTKTTRRRSELAPAGRAGRRHRCSGRRPGRADHHPRHLRRVPDARGHASTIRSSPGRPRSSPVSGCCRRRPSSSPTRWSAGPPGTPWACPSGATRSATGGPGRRRPGSRPTGQATGDEGGQAAGGRIAGTSLHGLLEGDAFRSAFLATVARRAGVGWVPSGVSFAAAREARFDRLADGHRSPPRRHRAGTADRPGPPGLWPPGARITGRSVVILFLTNAPSEILALRSLIEGLPEGFPPVRAALATGSAGPDLGGVEVVLVRLLGGASAWAGAVRGSGPPLPDGRNPSPGLRRGSRAGRPADGGVHRPERHRRPGLRIPGARRPSQPRAPAALRLRHRRHDRVRVRPAGRGTGHGRLLPHPARRSPGRRRPVWWCSSTGPTWSPAIPASSTTSVRPSRLGGRR